MPVNLRYTVGVPAKPDVADPHWFPVDLHVPDRRFGFLRLSDDQVERAAFLDTRLDVPLADALPVPVADVPAGPVPARIGWLFHTSFCASTLLARALHVAPATVALKEPLVLRRLADARKSGWSLDGLVEPVVRLLGRPWHPGGAVVIKPTHVALNTATSLLAVAPTSRAVILTSPLVDFMISNLKKLPESQAKIGTLADRALRATTFGARLTPAALQPPDVIAASGLQWAAQRELVADVVTALGPSRVRVLDVGPLLADIAATTIACARWLELPIDEAALAVHARDAATRNAKAEWAPFSAEQRASEAEAVAAGYRAQIAGALAWLDQHVLPAMRPAARVDPPWPWP